MDNIFSWKQEEKRVLREKKTSTEPKVINSEVFVFI